MRELPAGTVTMLFSDIEGSTALLHRLGVHQYGEALSAQRALLRSAFSAGGGHEMGTEGDSFFVVFESADEAVRCCVAGQRALSGHDWPDGAAVRVRMGLHSGDPTRHEDGYIGLDVHKTARIAATAHGGQVVLSDATRHLAQPRLPADVSVRDLGLHLLKDIEAPERIYQLVATVLDFVVGSGDLEFLANALELSASITAGLGDGPVAARLAGAAEAVRREAGMPIAHDDAVLLEQFLARVRAGVTSSAWDAGLAAGRELTRQQAISLLLSSAPAPGTSP